MNQAVRAKLFRGLADPSRLMVLETLRNGPRCVSALVESTGLSQPNLSMHLACLRDCGLVRARRNGKFVNYELADPTVVRLLLASERVLIGIAKRIEACPRYEEPRRTRDKSKGAQAKRPKRSG